MRRIVPLYGEVSLHGLKEKVDDGREVKGGRGDRVGNALNQGSCLHGLRVDEEMGKKDMTLQVVLQGLNLKL